MGESAAGPEASKAAKAADKADKAYKAKLREAEAKCEDLGDKAYQAYKARFLITWATPLEWADTMAILKNLALKPNMKTPYRSLLSAFYKRIDTAKHVHVPQLAAVWASAQGSKWEAALRTQLKEVKDINDFDLVASKFATERDRELATGQVKWEDIGQPTEAGAVARSKCNICNADVHIRSECPEAAAVGGPTTGGHAKAGPHKAKEPEQGLTKDEVQAMLNKTLQKLRPGHIPPPGRDRGGARHGDPKRHYGQGSSADHPSDEEPEHTSKVVCRKCG
jgi:hypothetical protein